MIYALAVRDIFTGNAVEKRRKKRICASVEAVPAVRARSLKNAVVRIK